MAADPALRNLVQRIHEQSMARFDELHPSPVLKARAHETVLSLVGGGISTFLAVGVALVTALGFLGFPFEPWCERREVLATSVIAGGSLVKPGTRTLSPPAELVIATVHLPSLRCRVMACLGELFGVAGLILGRRRSRVVWLSALGVLLALMAMVPVIGCEILLTLR